MSVGERISELRKKGNMSQGDLAEALEVTRQAVSKWENGTSYPDTLKLIKLAEVLESDVEYIATGRKMVLRRPPVVIKSVETVEKIVEVPVPVEKIVEKVIEKPVVQYVEVEKEIVKEVPVVKKVYRTKYKRNPLESILIGAGCFFVGLIIGLLI